MLYDSEDINSLLVELVDGVGIPKVSLIDAETMRELQTETDTTLSHMTSDADVPMYSLNLIHSGDEKEFVSI